MALDIHGIIAWFLIGMLGAIPAQFMGSRGYGAAGDIGIGIAGGLAGGFLLSLLGVPGQLGLVLSAFAAALGAALLTILARARPGHARMQAVAVPVRISPPAGRPARRARPAR